MDHVECIVVGAGVVGLAIARELAMQGREVVVVESNVHIGEETSSRSNEVVHAGFLYPPGSLKERMCLKGRDMLYAYCAERQVACSRIGKLVPALDEAELALLQNAMPMPSVSMSRSNCWMGMKCAGWSPIFIARRRFFPRSPASWIHMA